MQARVTDRLADFPLWALVIMLFGVLLIYNFATSETYQKIFENLWLGIRFTAIVTLSAYSISIVVGLLTALGQLSSNIIIRNLAMLYVQVIRGVPIIVQIFYWAFVLTPALVLGINTIGGWLAAIGLLGPENALAALTNRDINFLLRGILALSVSYGAFSSEIFRAGIQSIEKGQIEAAKAVGLTWFQSFRLIILPQAFRRILPPLGNDFIAMLKESSLVSVLGVQEITQLGKKYAAASFLFPQTYNTVAFLYLSMTLLLSMGVRYMERRLKSTADT
jgi:polar amino acid transport system permease protein